MCGLVNVLDGHQRMRTNAFVVLKEYMLGWWVGHFWFQLKAFNFYVCRQGTSQILSGSYEAVPMH